MMVVFALWAVIGYYELRPDGSYHKPIPIVSFWHGATCIEFIGTFWAYVLTCFPIFISDEAIAVGRALSSSDEPALRESLRLWEKRCLVPSQKWCSPASLINMFRRISVEFLIYVADGARWNKYILRVTFSVLCSRQTIRVLLSGMWVFTLSALSVGYFTSSHGMDWNFGQLLSLAMVILPVQSFISAIASTLPLTPLKFEADLYRNAIFSSREPR